MKPNGPAGLTSLNPCLADFEHRMSLNFLQIKENQEMFYFLDP